MARLKRESRAIASPEGCRITSAQIAARLTLSRTTVSLVLSGRGEDHRIAASTARRIIAAARDLGYRPNAAALQLAGKSSNSLGVLVTSEMMIDLRLIEAMEVLAAQRAIRFVVGHAIGSSEQVRDYLEDLRSRGVDGVFSFFHHHPAHRTSLLPELLRFRNVVFYEQPKLPKQAARAPIHYVSPDFSLVGRLAARHLIAQGRQRIGLVLRESFFPYAMQRRAAHDSAMRAVHRSVGKQLTWVMTERTTNRWTDPFTLELALRAVDDLVVDKKADAIVAVNDLFAAALIAALRKRGRRVPDDVAVLGCDNEAFGPFVDPPLTTIDLHLGRIAQAMMQMMFDLLDGRAIPQCRRGCVVEPELIVRQST